MKKCDAKCDAKQNFFTQIHLWLRKNTFYSIVELPRVNGKRRYQRISLHTSSYYEAVERLNYMSIEINKKIAHKMKIKLAINPFINKKDLSILRDEAIREYNEECGAIYPREAMFDERVNNAIYFNSIQRLPYPLSLPQKAIPKHTIQEIFNSMLLKANNKVSSNSRKKNMLEKMLKEVGLSFKDDYSRLHDIKIIEQISKNVLALTGVKNGAKKDGYLV